MKRDASTLFQHLATVQAKLEADTAPVSGGLSRGAFLETDPVLMQLAKQRAQARKDYQRLSRDGLFGEAMADVAHAQMVHLEQLYAQRLAELKNQRAAELNRDNKKDFVTLNEEARIKKDQAAVNVYNDKMQAKRKRNQEFMDFIMLLIVLMSFGNFSKAPQLRPS